MRFVAALTVAALSLLQAVQQDRPSFRSNTRLIEVSVVVTDRNRHAVPGLTAGDFQIFDNGQPQKVELFSIEGGSAPAPVPSRPALAAGEFSNATAPVGSVTIVLLDHLNTGDNARMYARDHVVRFLEGIAPGDRVGLYVLDGMGVLRVLHDFTSDAGALVRAVAGLRANTSQTLAAEEDMVGLEAEIARLLGEDGISTNSKEMQAHFAGNRAVYTIDALESISHHLAGLQSRKNLIWVSAAFPLTALRMAGRVPDNEITRATRALNDANVSLYAVDARGLLPTFTGRPGQQVVTTLSMVQGNQDILQITAERTGGLAFVNTNDIHGAITRAAGDARMSYVLGYYASDEHRDGYFHRIDVKVNRPGLDVRHRRGYYAGATEKQANAQRREALNAAVVSPINASGLGLTLRIDPIAGTSAEYRVTVRVQPGAIALERRGDELRGALDVIVAQVRADGAEGRTLEKRVDISVSDQTLPQFQREGAIIEHTFTLVPSAARLRVVVRDVRTGAIGAIGVSRQQMESIER